MTAETILSKKALSQFRTLKDLGFLSTGKNRHTWGLCQKGLDLDFRYGDKEWELVSSLEEIYEKSRIQLGDLCEEEEKVIVFIGVDIATKQPSCTFFKTNSKDFALQTRPDLTNIKRSKWN